MVCHSKREIQGQVAICGEQSLETDSDVLRSVVQFVRGEDELTGPTANDEHGRWAGHCHIMSHELAFVIGPCVLGKST